MCLKESWMDMTVRGQETGFYGSTKCAAGQLNQWKRNPWVTGNSASDAHGDIEPAGYTSLVSLPANFAGSLTDSLTANLSLGISTAPEARRSNSFRPLYSLGATAEGH
jgi:hypothetical protein